jgi:hypothetical protein
VCPQALAHNLPLAASPPVRCSFLYNKSALAPSNYAHPNHEPIPIRDPAIQILREALVEAQESLHRRQISHRFILKLGAEENQLCDVDAPFLSCALTCGCVEWLVESLVGLECGWGRKVWISRHLWIVPVVVSMLTLASRCRRRCCGGHFGHG